MGGGGVMVGRAGGGEREEGGEAGSGKMDGSKG